MRSAEYRRAIADVLCSASRLGLIDRWWRVAQVNHDLLDPRGGTSAALYLVDKLCEPDHHNPRLWLGMRPLQDELGLCVAELRALLHVEKTIARSVSRLVDLQARVAGADEGVRLHE
jgi:hypothetical protein